MITLRSDYIWGFQQGIIVIIDLDTGNKSVTNDARNVIADISKKIKNIREVPVIYRDSQGVFDYMLINEQNQFAGFSSIGTTDITDALRIARDDYLDKVENQ